MAITIKGTDNQQYLPIKTNNDKTNTENARVVDNPAGTLGADAFLKLFIETLKNQSIDSTTDIKEIMDYTASMTTVQTNNTNKKALEDVVKTLKSNSEYTTQYGLLPAIGKIAVTNKDLLKFDGKKDLEFSMYIPDNMEHGVMEIINKEGVIARTIPLDKYKNATGEIGKDDKGVALKDVQGLISLSWDGTLLNGAIAEKNEYHVKINYKNDKGVDKSINLGEYKVQSVKFKGGTPYLNVGQFDVAFKDILELKDK
jgi:flagellar hook assembly protein FlgD